MGIARDITEKKNNDQKAADIYRRFQTVMKNFPNGGVFLFDQNMKYIHAEGAGLEPVGLKPESIIGKTVRDVFPPEVSDIAYKNQMLLFEGETCYYEVEFGGNIYGNWGGPVIGYENKIEEGVVFACDITALKKTQWQLQNSLNRFSAFVKHLQTGVFYINANGEILEVNEAMVQIIGFSSEKKIRQINIFHFQPFIDAGYTAKLKECIDVGDIVYGKALYTDGCGKKKYIQFFFVPIKDKDNGVVTGVIANNEDMTERKKAEEEIGKPLTE